MIEAVATGLNLAGFGLRMAGRRRLMWWSLWLSLPANIAAIVALVPGAHWPFILERIVFLAGAGIGLWAWAGDEPQQ